MERRHEAAVDVQHSPRRQGLVQTHFLVSLGRGARYGCQDTQAHCNWTSKTLQGDYHAGFLSSADFGNFPLDVSYKNRLEPFFFLLSNMQHLFFVKRNILYVTFLATFLIIIL